MAINELEERLEVQLTPEKRGTVPVAKHMQIDMNSLTAYLNVSYYLNFVSNHSLLQLNNVLFLVYPIKAYSYHRNM